MNQFLSRRTFILIPTMSILKIIAKPMQVLASSLVSKDEWNLSKDEWKSRLSPESYYILREEGTERAFSSQLNLSAPAFAIILTKLFKLTKPSLLSTPILCLIVTGKLQLFFKDSIPVSYTHLTLPTIYSV